MSEKLERAVVEMAKEEAEKQAESTERAEAPKPGSGEALRALCKGTMELVFPFTSRGQEVTALEYDLCGLSSTEMLNALDRSTASQNLYGINNEQAIWIFAQSAAKNAPTIRDGGGEFRLYDAADIRERISGVDLIKAVKIAKLFYIASSRAAR